MGRHDLTLGNSLSGRAGLAAGLYGPTPILTATGWVPMQELRPGDLLVTLDHGLSPLLSLRTEVRGLLWDILVPEGALGNEAALAVPPGQPVLVQTPHALPFCGEPQALVPATALEGWRGIAAHVPPRPEGMLRLRLSRPGLVQAGPGLVIGAEGAETPERDLIRLLLTQPGRPVLPLAAARQLMATLIAGETGQALREAEGLGSQAALVRPPNRA